MKEAQIKKESGAVGERELQQIGAYTRRPLHKEEVYVFTLLLCDNEIDRDGERFSIPALFRLKDLFLGKTGIFDHVPKGQNQMARIFDTWVEKQDKMTQAGEPYHCLCAKAYMVRTSRTADLILEIEAGIKKEVSVGCAVEEIRCSICGANRRENGCSHENGKQYDGKTCHSILDKPTDAYEWSFVAVPAQRNAGVVKQYQRDGLKKLELEQEVTLKGAELFAVRAQLEQLRKRAELGEAYEKMLRRDLVKYGSLSQSGIPPQKLEQIGAKLDAEELVLLSKAFEKQCESFVPQVQLCAASHEEEKDLAFQI